MLLELGHDHGSLAEIPTGPFRYNLGLVPLRLPADALSPAAFGVLDEHPYWNAIFDLYRQDELKRAVEVMEKIGIGTCADYAIAGDIIYLEAATSDASEIVRIDEHLEVECIREQLPFPFDELGQRLAGMAPGLRNVFEHFPRKIDTLLTLLVNEATLPAACWRDGYFTPKELYGKICMPMPRDVDSILAGFTRGLVYQYAFEATARRSEFWLLEAATALDAEPGKPTSIKWLDPDSLSRALAEMGESQPAIDHYAVAQRQCSRIGHYLIAKQGASRFVDMLIEHERLSAEPGLGSVTDRALKKVYGLSTADLFATARV